MKMLTGIFAPILLAAVAVAQDNIEKIKLRTRAGHSFTILRPIELESIENSIPELRVRGDLFAASAVVARNRTMGDVVEDDDFGGSARKAAKTSIAPGSTRTYASLTSFLRTLPNDDTMRALHISDGAESNRVAQENRNVSFTAYLFATKRQRTDNDYHLIVGSTSSPQATTRFLNIEVSGLPQNQFRARLERVRKKFDNLYEKNEAKPPGTHYEFFQPAMKVRVKGSLFFDSHHAAGEAKAGDYEPQTAWEIHPITDIVFDPR